MWRLAFQPLDVGGKLYHGATLESRVGNFFRTRGRRFAVMKAKPDFLALKPGDGVKSGIEYR